MTVYCCVRCRQLLSHRRRTELLEFVDGHWYGCSRCGREVCTSCGVELGRRCDRCGGKLELDRKFPLRVIPDGDWRSFLPTLDEGGRWWMRNEELVAYVTDERVDAIVSAIPAAATDAFWSHILGWEVSRRLGELDHVAYLGGPFIRLDDAWRSALARLAGFGLAGPSGYDEAALSLALLIDGWSRLGDSATPVLAELERALVDGRPFLRERALAGLARLQPSWAELRGIVAGLLSSPAAERRRVGLRAIVSVRNRRAWSPHLSVEQAGFDWLVDAIVDLDPEAVAASLCRSEDLWPNQLAKICSELGLGSALVERVPEMIVPELPILEPGSGDAALAEMLRILAERRPRAKRRARELAWTFCERPDPTHVDVYLQMLEHRMLSHCGLSALLRLGPVLSAEARARVLAHLHALDEVPFALRNLPSEIRREWSADDELIAALLPGGPTVQTLTYEPIQPPFADSPWFWSAVERDRPRLLFEIQRELARPEEDAWTRAGLMIALGRLRRDPGDGAETLLLDALANPDELVRTRLRAARALSERPLAGPSRERALALTDDPSALVRAWVFRLLDDPNHWTRAERDPSELVRLLASEHHRRSET